MSRSCSSFLSVTSILDFFLGHNEDDFFSFGPEKKNRGQNSKKMSSLCPKKNPL